MIYNPKTKKWEEEKEESLIYNPKTKKWESPNQTVTPKNTSKITAPIKEETTKKTKKKETTTQFKTKEAEEKAKQKALFDYQFSKKDESGNLLGGLSWDEVQAEKKKYTSDSAEFEYLSRYTNFATLQDFDKALEQERLPFEYNGQRLSVEQVKQNGLTVPLQNAPRQIKAVDMILNGSPKNTIQMPQFETSGVISVPNFNQQTMPNQVSYAKLNTDYIDALVTAKNIRGLDNQFDYYKRYTEEKDFKEKSVFDSSKVEKNLLGSMKRLDEMYYYMNSDKKTKEKHLLSMGIDPTPYQMELLNLSEFMTEDEKGVFNYLFNKDREKAEKYFEDIKPNLSRRNAQRVKEQAENMAEENPVASSVLSVPLNIVGGASAGIQTVLDKAQGKETDYYGNAFGGNLIAETIRNKVGKDIAKKTEGVEVLGTNVPSFLYKSGMSMSDTLLGSQIFGKGYSVIAGSSAYQSKARELYEAGEDRDSIEKVAIASGTAEVLFEYVSLDKLLTESTVIGAKQVFKTALKQAGVEASEEFCTEIANIFIDEFGRGGNSNLNQMRKELKSQGYSDEEIEKKINQQVNRQITEALVGGALSGGFMGGGMSAINNSKYTDTEKKFISDTVQERVDAQEKESGKKLTTKERVKIQDDVVNELHNGDFTREELEKRFGGDSYTEYQKLVKDNEEYTTLLKMKNGDRTGEQDDRLYDLRKMNNEKSFSDRLAESRSKLAETVKNYTGKSSMLDLSYGERGRRTQQFTASEEQMKKYSEKERAIVQKAIDYGEMNNTRKAHEFVDLVAKLSADKGVSFDFTNNEKLKNSGFALEGKTINGFKSGNNITVNLQSKNALNTVVGHEITHVLEGSKELYKALQDNVIEYAKQKGVYDSKYADIVRLYESQVKEGTDAEALYNSELTADLVGEYIFSDTDFVRNLSMKNRNVFQKVYDEIKYMLKSATAGSDAERQLLKAKKIFEDVYRDTKKNITENTQYKLVGKEDGIEVYETSEETQKLSYTERKAKLLDVMVNEYSGRTAKFTKNGNTYYAMYDKSGVKKGIHGDNKSDKKGYKAKINIGADGNYIELAENSLYQGSSVEQGKDNKFHKNAQSWDYYVKTIKSDGNYFDVLINVKDTGNEHYVYDITLKEATSLPDQLRSYDGNSIASNTKIPQLEQNATEKSQKENKTQFSVSEIDSWLDDLSIEDLMDELRNMGITEEDFNDIDTETTTTKKPRAKRRIDEVNKRLKEIGLSFNGTKSASWTDDRINTYLYGGHYGSTNPNYAQAYITYMSPHQFLNLTSGGKNSTLDMIQKESAKYGEVDFEKLGNDSPIRLYIEEGKNGAKVVGHEGRHRMYLLGQAGFNKIPILMFDYNTKYNKTYKDSLELTTQKFNDTDFISKTRDVVASDVVPFSQGNRDLIIEKFGSGNKTSDIQYSVSDNKPIAPIKNGIRSEDVALERPIAPIDHIVEANKMMQTDHLGEVNGMFAPIGENVQKRAVQGMDTLPLPQDNVKGVEVPKKQTNNEKGVETPQRPTKNGKELRSWVETSTESEALGGAIKIEDLDQRLVHYEPISNKKTLENANNKLDSFDSYENAMTYFNSQMNAKKVDLVDLVMGERLLQEAIKRKDTKSAGELIQNISILGTELGQKVQALSIIQRLTPEGQLKVLQKIVNRGKMKGDKIFKDVELTDSMRKEILDAYNEDGSYDQDKLNSAIENVKQQLADQMDVTPMEKINAWRMLSMLGNPKTHMRNIVSNATMYVVREAKNSVARTIETIAPIKNRTKTWKRASDDVKAFATQSTKEAESLFKGEHRGTQSTTLNDIKAKRKMFKTKVLQNVYGLNSDLLQNEDTFFKKPVYRSSLQEFLTANGIKTQEDIKKNAKLVEKGKQYAMEQCLLATFQQDSALAEWISSLERRNAVTQVAVGSVLPFKKTPINIAKTGLAYSPLGFAKTLAYDIPQVVKGKMEASQLIDNISQAITGTALMLTGYLLSSLGFLNGGGEDDKEGEYDYQLGEQSYSINIGGKSYSLSWLTPASMPLFIGANLNEVASKGEDLNFDATVDALASTLDPMSEMSFLSSLDTVLSSYEKGMSKWAGVFENAGQSYVSQFVPTLLSQVAQVTDDTKRSTSASSDSNARMPELTARKLMYKIPGLRQMLEPTIDIHGNEIKQNENVLIRGVESFIAPYNTKDYIADEVDNEIKRLYSQTGDNGLIPNVPSSKVQFKGVNYKMSAEEYTDYKKTYGQTANKYLRKLFETSTYKNATIEDKNDMVNKVYDYAKDVAHKEYLEKEGIQYTNTTENNVPVYRENKIKGAIDNDMTVGEYTLYSKNRGEYYVSKLVGGFDDYEGYKDTLNSFESDKNAQGETIKNSLKNKKFAYINNLNVDFGAKILLWKQQYPYDDRYNVEIIEYLNNREDISYEEMVEILTELDFKVSADGTVRW